MVNGYFHGMNFLIIIILAAIFPPWFIIVFPDPVAYHIFLVTDGPRINNTHKPMSNMNLYQDISPLETVKISTTPTIQSTSTIIVTICDRNSLHQTPA